MKKYLLLLTVFILMGCSSNKIVNIEQSNNYEWQKYMNSAEFVKLKEGMSYMDVVEIAGGAGKLQSGNKKSEIKIYLWLDERLLTQAYEIRFKKDELTSKKVVERRGHSTRE